MKNKTHKEINVAVVTSTYARAQEDHQVPWMRELVARVKDDVQSIHVFAPSFKGLKTHTIDEVPVHRFRYAPKSVEALTHDEGAPSKSLSIKNKLLVIPYILLGALSIFIWCVRHKIDVLHVHWPFPHGIWSIAPKYLLGVKVVAMSHGAELAMARNSSVIRGVLGWLLRRADTVCANSSHTAAEVAKVSGREDVNITPYGATVQQKGEEDALPQGSRLEAAVPTLLFCGRLIQRKGIDVLLKAMPQILAKQKVKLVITGEGDRKSEWMELSKTLKLEQHVRFAGFVSNEELADLYSNCTAYVHPAIFDDKGDTEGLGVVLIEALSYKKPVIASGVGGIVDVIKDGETGLLVQEKCPEQLAAAVQRVIDEPALSRKLGEQGYQHVRNFFDWDRIAAQMLSIFSNEELNTKEEQAKSKVTQSL